MLPKHLQAFIIESNRIERIYREPTEAEIEAHQSLLACQRVTLHTLRAFVQVIANAPLRDQVGLNVVVGNHRPPVGGPHIIDALEKVLQGVNDKHANPYTVHVKYETLHPFIDGNGRSGRALWLYMMARKGFDCTDGEGNFMGFLHLFYYQALANSPERT